MAIHLLNCFTCNARWPKSLKTGLVCLLVDTDQGPVLVDTGLGSREYVHPTWMTRLFRIITVMPFDPSEAAIHKVAALGYHPEEVHHIILTHMHFDHCSGLSDFPSARVHVHRREYEAFTDGKILHWDEFAYMPRHIEHRPAFSLYERPDERWCGFDVIRLPFTPPMYLVPLFGHSRGHCGVAIRTKRGWFFHAGDAGAVYDHTTPAWLIKTVLGPYDPLLRTFMMTHPDVLVSNSHMFPAFFSKYPVVV